MLSVGRLFLVLGFLHITGCDSIKTTQPLSDPLTAEPDQSLYGHWLATEKKDGKIEEAHVFIGKHTTEENPESIMEFGMVIWKFDDKKVPEISLMSPLGYFTVTRIGKTSYLNMFGEKVPEGQKEKYNLLSEKGSYAEWTKNKGRDNTVFKYSLEGTRMQVWLGGDETKKALDKLIAEGELKLIYGEVTYDSLVRYLRKNGGDKLFMDPPVTFDKMP